MNYIRILNEMNTLKENADLPPEIIEKIDRVIANILILTVSLIEEKDLSTEYQYSWEVPEYQRHHITTIFQQVINRNV